MSIDQNAGSTSPAEPPVVVAPPLTNEQLFEVERTARLLDPDLYAAVQQGNQTIIQAIAMGATTTDQVVNNLVRMGVTPTMCPPGVGQLVAERQKELEIKREEEERFQKNMVAGLGTMAFGMGMMGMMPRAADAQTADTRSDQARNWALNPPNAGAFAAMNEVQQMAYFSSLSAMSLDDWSNKLTKDDRDQHLKNAEEKGAQIRDASGKEVATVIDEMRAKGRSEGDIELVRNVMATGDVLPNTPEGRRLVKENVEKLKRERPDLASDAEKFGEEATKLYAGQAAANAAAEGQTANAKDDHGLSKTKMDKAVAQIDIGTGAAVAALNAGSPEAAQKPLAETTKAMESAARLVDAALVHAAPMHSVSAAEDARTANLAARQQVDGATIAANDKPQAKDEFGNDPAPAALAAAPTSPRLTIAIPPDKVGVESALLNRLGAAANDPAKAPEPEENRRPTGPATGMGSSA